MATNTSAGSLCLGTLTPGTPMPFKRLEIPTPESSSFGGSSEAEARYQDGRSSAATSASAVAPPAVPAIQAQRLCSRSQIAASSKVRSS